MRVCVTVRRVRDGALAACAEEVDLAWSSVGQVFRWAQLAYGRCLGPIVVADPTGGVERRVGWVFLARVPLEDNRRGHPAVTELRETWVELREEEEVAA